MGQRTGEASGEETDGATCGPTDVGKATDEACGHPSERRPSHRRAGGAQTDAATGEQSGARTGAETDAATDGETGEQTGAANGEGTDDEETAIFEQFWAWSRSAFTYTPQKKNAFTKNT